MRSNQMFRLVVVAFATTACLTSAFALRRLETLEQRMDADGGSLTLQPIGVVRSVYRLCVGTPRQGLLAPHARGRIELDGLREAAACVDGLENFSHIWIVFVFHLNTVGKSQSSKIAPPALGGDRVGVLATRSPHRFNPVGMTLAKLEGVRTVRTYVEGKKKPMQRTYLDVSGIDLVDGTPVLDIKPYVAAYDAPLSDGEYSMPDWVSEGLATQRPVDITVDAQEQLRSILSKDPSALEFYGGNGETFDETYSAIAACIQEVLAIDVRSQWQTRKARDGKSKAERSQRLQQATVNGERQQAESSTQQIDNLLVEFSLEEACTTEREESMGSGAEDKVVVTSIQLIDRKK